MVSNRTLEQLQYQKNSNTAKYRGKTVTIITVFSDIDLAMVEDENGNILDVPHSLLSQISST